MIQDIESRREQLADIVCHAFRITIEDLKGPTKAREVFNARCVYSYLARHILGDVYMTIGRFLNKDHHSVINQIAEMNALIFKQHPAALIMKEIERDLIKQAA